MPNRKVVVERSAAVGIIAPILLLLMGTICGVIIIECAYNVYLARFLPNRVEYHWGRRIIFFGGSGTIFNNKDDIFTYSANKTIRNLTIYFSDHTFNVEFDYRFHTNNFGLVQDADVVPNLNSMLLLGDSFTEGQGAAPWFPHVAGEIRNLGYQPINGGLSGTGFAQWAKLERYLTSNSIQIRKIVVLFISDDYTRALVHYSDQQLQCLSIASRCNGDEGVYPLPSTEELSSWVDRIRDTRWSLLLFKERAKKYLPASYQVYEFVRTRPQWNLAESDAAISKLIEEYGRANVTFIHLPQKDEGDKPNILGLSARNSIEKAGGKIYDGFKLCGLGPSDYHVNDGHPNEKGYDKIAFCVNRIIKQQEGAQP
jgi:hypothetical protein